ncbi:hypothetical protein ACWGLF_46725 [Streptomyces puniciscabiei]
MVLAVVAVPAAASSASAAAAKQNRPAATEVDPGTVIATVQKIYSIYKQFFGSSGGGGLTLDQATQQILTAINSSQTAIISQIDQVAAADVRGCAEATVINFADIQALTPDNRQAFAMNATACATQADSLLNSISDEAAVDQLGYAVNTIGPLAMFARAYAGLTTPDLRATLINADNAVVSKVITKANCTWETDTVETMEVICTAYNGNVGTAGHLYHGNPPGQQMYDTAMAAATVNTSRPEAITALTQL